MLQKRLFSFSDKAILLTFAVLLIVAFGVSSARAEVCFLPYGECDTDITSDEPTGNCEGYDDTDKSSIPGWICDSCEDASGTHYKCTINVCDEKFEEEEKVGEGWKECETCVSGGKTYYYCEKKDCPEGSSTVNESNLCLLYSAVGYSGDEICYGNGEDQHHCKGSPQRPEGDGWSCDSPCLECDGELYYECTPSQCPSGYAKVSSVNCDIDDGNHLDYKGYSGGEACAKCVANTCPTGFTTSSKVCDDASGYELVSNGMSDGKECTKCAEKSCPTGFSTSIDTCDIGWGVENNGYAGGLPCKKCTQLKCEINYASSTFSKDDDSAVILNFATIKQDMLPSGVFVEPVYEDFFTASRVYISSMTKQQWLSGGNIRLPLKRDHDFIWSNIKVGNEAYNGMLGGYISNDDLSASVAALKEFTETLLDDVPYLEIKASGAEVLDASSSATFSDADYLWIKHYDHKYDGHCTVEGGKFKGQAIMGLYFRECERGYSTEVSTCESGGILTKSNHSQAACYTCKVSCPNGYGISPYAYDEGMISDNVCLNGVDFEDSVSVGEYSCYKCR